MKCLKTIFHKSNSFLKIYLKDYLKLLIKPIIIGIVGTLFLALCFLGPIGALIALFTSIPALCYAFWNGYLITYSLNYAVESYMRTENKVSLIDCYDLAKKDSGKLAAFLGFALFFIFLVYLPVLIIIPMIFANSIESDIAQFFLSYKFPYKYTLILNIPFLILIPFYNFLNQAFFYRKSKDGFVKLLKNCYTNMDKTGILLCVIFVLGTSVLFVLNAILYAIVALIANPFIYCANMLWYRLRHYED